MNKVGKAVTSKGRPIPQGTYKCKVNLLKVKGEENDKRIYVEYEITEGEFNGEKFYVEV